MRRPSLAFVTAGALAAWGLTVVTTACSSGEVGATPADASVSGRDGSSAGAGDSSDATTATFDAGNDDASVMSGDDDDDSSVRSDGGSIVHLDSGADAADAGSSRDAGSSDAATSRVVCGDMGGLQAGSPWPMEGACPSRANHSNAAPLVSPHVAWRYDIAPIASAEFLGAPVIAADGTIYVVGYGANGDASATYFLYAFRNKTLAFTTPIGNLATVPAIAKDGTVFVHVERALLGIDPATGHITTNIALTAGSLDSPTILGDGTVVVLDGTRMVFVANGAIARSFVLPTTPAAQTFLGTSVAVSAKGTIYAIARESGQAAQLLYGIDASASAVLGPITMAIDSNGFPQIDNDGNILVVGDGELELYADTGTLKSTKVFSDTLDQERAGYGGEHFWIAPEMNGPLRFDEESDTSKTFSSKAGAALSAFAVVGDGSVVFFCLPPVVNSPIEVDGWGADGTARWSVTLDRGNSDLFGVAIDAAGTVYVPFGPTLYAIAD